jgi:hypothetical protein
MTATTLSYNYSSQGGGAQPPSGACYQSTGGNIGNVSFNNVDNNSNDNTTFFSNVHVGEQITVNGVAWTIQTIQLRTANILFTVTPAVAATPYGVSDFIFGQSGGGYLDVIILAGESLSSEVDLTVYSVAMLIVSTAWSPANMTFLVSMDGVDYYDLFDASGTEVLRAIKPGTAILIDPAVTTAANYMRVRSGPRDNPVPQRSDVVIRLATVKV